MNELKIFENTQFGTVRTFTENGKTLFCGKDVAMALGYKETHKAISRHCKGGTKRPVPTSGGTQETIFITKGDVYRLAASSKLPDAEKFESWIFDEVLPSIQETGGYIYTTPEMTDAEIMAKAVLIAQTEIEKRDERIKELESEKEILLPKANYCDEVLKSEETLTATQIAKDYCISSQKLNFILNVEGIQYKVNNKWNLYAKYADKGLAINQTFQRYDDNGYIKYYTYLCWTQKGREFIKTIMERRGIKPHEDL